MKMNAYMKNYRGLTPLDLGVCALTGAVMAAVFVFIFPGASMSTLMHNVFQLPGPGAGVALFVGPFAILAGLLAYMFCPRPGAALIAMVTYALIEPAGQVLFNPQGQGRYPYLMLMLAFLVPAVLTELLLNLPEFKRVIVRYGVPAMISNVALLWFYWIAIFPRYPMSGTNSWPFDNGIDPSANYLGHIQPVLVLVPTAIVGALVIGATFPIIFTWVRKRVRRRDMNVVNDEPTE
jgi:hypothetical protein